MRVMHVRGATKFDAVEANGHDSIKAVADELPPFATNGRGRQVDLPLVPPVELADPLRISLAETVIGIGEEPRCAQSIVDTAGHGSRDAAAYRRPRGDRRRREITGRADSPGSVERHTLHALGDTISFDMAGLSLTNVRKVYDGKVLAVDDLSLDVPDGELMVLVGPSGCGKSTTLRLVAGLEKATGGTIRIGDRVVNDVPPKHRDVAMVFQNYALYPHMTVAQNLGFALKMRKMPRVDREARVQSVAATMGITELLGRKPKALSGGQQQRVALGRALVRAPALFLFDEPLSNLDARLRLTMRTEIRSLQRETGTTSLYVTHDQEEAMTLGDRIAVLCDGRLQQAGPPREVYATPANRFVATFIGAPAMNLIEGRLEGNGTGLRFHENGADAGVDLPSPLAASLAAHAGAPVALGVRPTALRRASDATRGPVLPVHVEAVELLGDATDHVGRTPGGQIIVARLPTDGTGDLGPVTLELDPTRLMFFAAGPFGRNLLVE